MFCAGCGTELEGGLNFCKRCGNRVGGNEGSAVAQNLASALPYIGVFGLLGFIAIIVVMTKSSTITPGLFGLIAGLYLSTLFGICYMILKQTAPFTLKVGHRKPGSVEITQQPNYLQPATTARLNEQTEMPASVTEQTTRNLDAVTRK